VPEGRVRICTGLVLGGSPPLPQGAHKPLGGRTRVSEIVIASYGSVAGQEPHRATWHKDSSCTGVVTPPLAPICVQRQTTQPMWTVWSVHQQVLNQPPPPPSDELVSNVAGARSYEHDCTWFIFNGPVHLRNTTSCSAHGSSSHRPKRSPVSYCW